jgi:ATP-dependent Zn protease
MLGEVQLDGSLLCVHHAELLRVEGSSETLLGTVFMMDQWLDNTDGEADEECVRRVEHQQNELVEQLRFNRTRISLIRDELLKEQDGTR